MESISCHKQNHLHTTYIHTNNIHTYIHTTYTQTYKQHTHKHTYIHTNIHVTQINIHTYNIHTNIHTYNIHRNIHTAHVHRQRLVKWSVHASVQTPGASFISSNCEWVHLLHSMQWSRWAHFRCPNHLL